MDMSYERGYEASLLSRSNFVMEFSFLIMNKYINILSGRSATPSKKFHSLR